MQRAAVAATTRSPYLAYQGLTGSGLGLVVGGGANIRITDTIKKSPTPNNSQGTQELMEQPGRRGSKQTSRRSTARTILHGKGAHEERPTGPLGAGSKRTHHGYSNGAMWHGVCGFGGEPILSVRARNPLGAAEGSSKGRIHHGPWIMK